MIKIPDLRIYPKPPFNFELLTALFAKWPNHFIETFSNNCYKRTLENEFTGVNKIENTQEKSIFLVRIYSNGSIEKPLKAAISIRKRLIEKYGSTFLPFIFYLTIFSIYKRFSFRHKIQTA